jgi:N6-L-threonylcarbamoyladenine synthase
MKILGIETSCDETAAAIVGDGRTILSNVIASQITDHAPYGGVVPEIASRRHVENIISVIRHALRGAGMDLEKIDAVAVTQGPGLLGSLLVGIMAAKALAYSRKIPLVPVHHVEGHIGALYLDSIPESPEPPFVALVASGGHTHLYHVLDKTNYRILGQTRDDAAGEAYDKVAKMLNLGYPGGPVIDRLAQKGRADSIHFPRPLLTKDSLEFSFSGLKTAVLYYLKRNDSPSPAQKADIAAAFQQAAVDVLVGKIFLAAQKVGVKRVAAVGGVAANSLFRSMLTDLEKQNDIKTYIPPPELCTDNAAMIASAGYYRFQNGVRAGMDLNAVSTWELGKY